MNENFVKRNKKTLKHRMKCEARETFSNDRQRAELLETMVHFSIKYITHDIALGAFQT